MTTTTDTQIFTAASAIGLVSGMRTFAAPAIVGQILQKDEVDCKYLDGVCHPVTANVLTALSIGELIADKLPMTPKRTRSFALIPRIVSGAFCGAVICASKKQSLVIGAMAGAFGATGGTFAAYHLRKLITESLDLPDAVVALAEDAFAVGLGILITKSVTEEKGAA